MNLHTNDTLGKRLVLQRSKAEVADLDWPCWTGDKDVIALEIAVNHWRRPAVKEQQTFEDLTTPVLENFQVELLETLYVPAAHVADSCTDSTPTLANRVSHHSILSPITTEDTIFLPITSPNIGWFSKLCRLNSKLVVKLSLRSIITHTWHVSLHYLVKY